MQILVDLFLRCVSLQMLSHSLALFPGNPYQKQQQGMTRRRINIITKVSIFAFSNSSRMAALHYVKNQTKKNNQSNSQFDV